MMPRLWLMQPVLLHLSQMELISIVAVHKGITSNCYQFTSLVIMLCNWKVYIFCVWFLYDLTGLVM